MTRQTEWQMKTLWDQLDAAGRLAADNVCGAIDTATLRRAEAQWERWVTANPWTAAVLRRQAEAEAPAVAAHAAAVRERDATDETRRAANRKRIKAWFAGHGLTTPALKRGVYAGLVAHLDGNGPLPRPIAKMIAKTASAQEAGQ